jgi:hypothetical protein
MKINRLRSIIKEAVNAYDLKEIEATAENAAMDAKLEAYDKAIQQCEDKIHSAENIEEIKDLMDEGKINELKKHLKNLQKSKEKLEKVKTKKNKGKEVVTDEPVEEGDEMDSMKNAIVPETELEEDDMPKVQKMGGQSNWNDRQRGLSWNSDQLYDDAQLEEGDDEEKPVNESFLKMQKLAGVITEAQYNEAFDQKASDIAMNFSNTPPNTPLGATPGTSPKKDINIQTIIKRIAPLIPQLKSNDTTIEFVDLVKAMIELIQTTNKESLTDQEILTALRKIITDKTKEITNKK